MRRQELVLVEQFPHESSTRAFYVIRYGTDGELDGLYASAGRLDVSSLGTVSDIAIDGDGESVIVASHDGPSAAHEPTVVRYDGDGSTTPDT